MPRADAVSKNMQAVYVQTETGLLHGYIHLHPGKRVTDEMNHGEGFFALTQATVYGADGTAIDQAPFMAVNKANVVWVRPDET
ncbi:MAG TPA: hypothetical protein VGH28_20325 [Polyangiaceae bacterium]|jgi:hypothetical protein